MWTSLSCVLCLFCAKNPQNRAMYSEPICSLLALSMSDAQCRGLRSLCTHSIRCQPALAGATLASFVLALLFFLSELLLYKTLSLKSALQPMIVAGVLLI